MPPTVIREQRHVSRVLRKFNFPVGNEEAVLEFVRKEDICNMEYSDTIHCHDGAEACAASLKTNQLSGGQ